MSKPEHTLQQLRKEIDSVDSRLVNLINRRAEMDIELSHLRRKLSAKDSSETISQKMESIANRNQGPIPNTALKGVYREILNGAFYLARATRVGYLGPQGTFSHLAASNYFGDQVDYENLRALEGVFEEVARGHVDFGLVPIENSTGGAIIETLDSFTDYFGRVEIHSEIRLPIGFSLLANC
jgi:chorismate mutase/prephenate dehydratase